jgi:prevent-host-death family protein
MTRTVASAEFEARCLALLDEVAQTRQPLVVTKDGKAVARVVPALEPRSLIGSVRQLVSDEELIEPLYEDWAPTFPE